MSFLTHAYIDHDHIAIEFHDESTSILTNHHQSKIFESASLIKLPIMIYIFEHLDDASRTSLLSVEDKVGGSGVLQNMSVEKLSINDLIFLMIVVSDNSATNILINHFGIHHINQFIQQQLDCKNTLLNRMMMDEEAIKAGKQNVTTAEDMIKILRYITQSPYKEEMLAIMQQQHLNEKVSIYKTFYEESLTYYTKSGEFDNIINDVGIIKHNEHFYYYCFLSNIEKPETAQDFSHDFGSYIIKSILNI